MSLQYDGESQIKISGGSNYGVSERFQVVLDSLPDRQVPKSLVLIGLLTEELVPVSGNASRHQAIARSVTDPPQADVPAETVERILWVLSEVRETLPADRKQTIGRILSNSGLNAPGTNRTGTTEQPIKNTTSTDEDQSTPAIPDSSETSDNQPISGGEYECEFCANQFQTDCGLMSHLTSCPDKPAGVQFSCDQCSRTYHSQCALDKHLDRSHKTTNTEKTEHRCSDCNTTFDSPKALIEHGTTHSDSRSENRQTNDVYVARNDIGFLTHYNTQDSYGFISTSGVPDDVFFHRSDVDGRTPTEDDYLQYDIRETDRGYKAIDITHKPRTEQPDDPFASTRTRWGGQ